MAESESKEPGRTPAAEPAQDDSRKLKELLEASVLVTVREDKGSFTLYDGQLGLLLRCKDLGEGYRQLRQEREKRLGELAEAGILDLATGKPAAQAPERGPSLLKQLRPFLIKATVVACLFLFFLSAIGGALRDVGYNLEKQLEGLSHWGPDKIEMHREKSQRIADRLRPTVQALLTMFQDTAQNATAPAPQDNATGK